MDENRRETKKRRETVRPLGANGGKPPLRPVVSKASEAEPEPEEVVS
ncbi:MAG: hypothetical protein ACR2OF_08405 [Hyphomicrobium sp.]